MRRKIIHLVAGARPNFMKIAPLYHALRASLWARPVIVHTGQHYDPQMSATFFHDLRLPDPHHSLNVGSGSHGMQTAGVLAAYESLIARKRPDWVVVVGDVNSTMAAALAASKLRIPVAHLEAGLRSRDRTMPEEINRLVTDAVSDLLLTPSPDASLNLRCEGIPASRIRLVGNIMIDSYEFLRAKIERAPLPAGLRSLTEPYGVVTLHRPSNVDDRRVLTRALRVLGRISRRVPLVFPIHPRTRLRLRDFGLLARARDTPGLHITTPLSYVPFMSLVRRASFVITDSGGIQEETTYLGVPCLTLRENTERPITVTQGTNRLTRLGAVEADVARVLDGRSLTGRRPRLWDGQTAGRVVRALREVSPA